MLDKLYMRVFELCVEPKFGGQNVLAVHRQWQCKNRAARYFLNVGKYTLFAAVNGDTAWYPKECRLWMSGLNHWCRLVNKDNDRLNKRVFVWCDLKGNDLCRNRHFKVRNHFQKYNGQVNYQI